MDRIQSLPPEIELAQLLQRCAARDVGAFRTLYDRTSPVLFARLLCMLRRRSAAEEALQEVYVCIWERAVQFQAHRGRALAWMVTLARHRAIDLMRRERVNLPGDDALAEHGGESGAESTDFARRCLTLAFVEGRSREEIARLTGSPLSVVKSRIRGSLLSLSECPSTEMQSA